MDSWNERLKPRPPIITEAVTKKQFESIVNESNKKLPFQKRINHQDDWIPSLQEYLESFLDSLKINEAAIANENYGLFAFLYHFEHIRHEKFIRNMKMVKKCLRNFDEVRLPEIITDVIEMLSHNKEAKSKKKIYLPSRKYLGYYFIRLIGCFRLFCKIVTYCYEAAFYICQKIACGHIIIQSAALLSMMGRLRLLFLDMANIIANHFASIMPFYFAFKASLFPADDLEDFPNILDELRNFVFAPCPCQDSPTLIERATEKKVSQIGVKIRKRMKQFKEKNVAHSAMPKTVLKRAKKRKLCEVQNDNDGNDSVNNISTEFFYKEIKSKKKNYQKQARNKKRKKQKRKDIN